MPDRRRLVREDGRTQRIAADFFQRAGDAAGIARELHGRRVGEKLALPRHGRLDQAAEEITDITEQEHSEPDRADRNDDSAGFAIESDASAGDGPQNAAAGEADDENAEDERGESQVEPH